MVDQELYDHSIEVLRLASKMSEQYYEKPLMVCYSGGKDSDVLVQLALESGIKFEVKNSHTTLDAPQTVYHIREKFKELESKGIHCEVIHSKYKDGKTITIWNLIEKNKMPPDRFRRYCCKYLKETTTPNRFIAVGVREEESVARKGRSDFQVKGQKPIDRITRDLDTLNEKYDEANSNSDDVADCKFIETAKQKKDLLCNPIYYWKDTDIWEFIHDRGIKYNPLYDMGFTRVGCVGCPLASPRERERQFAIFPKYKENFIKLFDRLPKDHYKNDDLRNGTGEDVFRWWIHDARFYGQTELEGWRDDDGLSE